jgi:2-hydroxychromene-2-carboxylate isomerase
MKLDWYFDFISPFAYLQHCQFDRLPELVEVNYKPILFAGLLNHWGNVGPAEIAPKRIFTYKYCYWLAKKNGIPFKMPPAHPFKSLSPLRLAIACDCEPHAIRIIFETIWKLGLDIESEEAVDYLESQLSIEKVSELVASQRVKDKLIENTKQAAVRNIFGVPTYSVAQGISGYENFWGLDAQDMMLDFIASPADFNDEQMMLIEGLPEGIQRKR